MNGLTSSFVSAVRQHVYRGVGRYAVDNSNVTVTVVKLTYSSTIASAVLQHVHPSVGRYASDALTSLSQIDLLRRTAIQNVDPNVGRYASDALTLL